MPARSWRRRWPTPSTRIRPPTSPRPRPSAASSTCASTRRGCTTCCARWSPRAPTATPVTTSAPAAASTSSSCRPTRPDRSTPPTAGGRPTATRWPGCSTGAASTWSASSTSTTGAPRCDALRRLAAGRQAGRADPRGRLPGRLRRGVGGRDARRRRPGRRGAATGPRPTSARRWPRWASCSTAGRASGRSSTPAPWRRRSTSCASLATSTRPTAPSGCAPPTSATTRTACSCGPTASPPTCCPTSPTTATSSARAEHLIDVVGPDHHGYVGADQGRHRRRCTTGARTSRSSSARTSCCCGAARRCKLSKRQGDIILLREDVIDEVGPDATRFTYLMQSVDTKLVFDLDVVVQRSMDNPVFYVQMAHARLAGIARNAAAKGVDRQPLDDGRPRRCSTHPREHEILTRAQRPARRRARRRATRRAPQQGHHVGRGSWRRPVHGFHHDCWVVGDDVAPELTQARLWLVEAARVGLVVGLDLLGVSRARADVGARRGARPPQPAARHRRRRRPTAGSRSAACDVLDLAAEFGTPLFVYDEAHLRARCREAVARVRRRRRLRHEGLPLPRHGPPGPRGGPAARRGDGRRAARARWPPACRPTASSCTATTSPIDELAAALEAGVRRVVVDSLRRARPPRRGSTPTACRVPRGPAAHHAGRRGAHPRVRPHRPGRLEVRLRLASGGAAEAARAAPRRSPSVELVGLHAHIGSQVFDVELVRRRPPRCMAALRPRRSSCPSCTLGGGLGVAYVEGESAPSITEWGDGRARRAVDRRGVRRRVTGRARPRHRRRRRRHALHASAPIKEHPGHPHLRRGRRRDERQPAARPLRQRLRGVPARVHAGADRRRPVRVVGKHCESGDVLVHEAFAARRPARRRRPVHAGDRRLRPLDGVELQQGAPPGGGLRGATDDARVVVRRETYADLAPPRPAVALEPPAPPGETAVHFPACGIDRLEFRGRFLTQARRGGRPSRRCATGLRSTCGDPCRRPRRAVPRSLERPDPGRTAPPARRGATIAITGW